MPTQRIIARRRRASTYITRRFHRPGTLAAPDQSPTPRFCETNPIYTRPTIKNAKRTLNKTQAAGLPPVFNPGLSAGALPHPKNAKRTQFSYTRCPAAPHFCKTNPIKTTSDAIGPPLYLTLTEVGDRPTAKKCETNPISSRGLPKIHETNPIPTYQVPTTPHLHKTNPISSLLPAQIRETNPTRPDSNIA